jgi:CubicO group peptidase (beta-lactamase class C family)
MRSTFGTAREVLQRAVAAAAFPAAVAEVGTSSRPLWRGAFGRLTFSPDAQPATDETVFDLASLTKVLATTPLLMRHVERGAVGLDDPVSRYIARWQSPDRQGVTIRDLLAHCGGLPAHRPFYRELQGRAAFEAAIAGSPLEYEPRSKSVYSDLGFMLLGFILEDMAPLPLQFDTLRAQMGGIQDLQFHPPDIWKNRRTAPTQENAFRGRLLVGEVDDDNTWALGGAAGQAGLFGTAAAVGECARHVLQVLAGRVGAFRQDTLETFVARRTDVPGSSRALGWDTMLPTSSCGTRMSPRAFGHTGFTGTSLWIDPDRRAYVVLLTNRVHPNAGNNAIKEVRRAFHDAVMEDLAAAVEADL